jgi:hypothetical protein
MPLKQHARNLKKQTNKKLSLWSLPYRIEAIGRKTAELYLAIDDANEHEHQHCDHAKPTHLFNVVRGVLRKDREFDGISINVVRR